MPGTTESAAIYVRVSTEDQVDGVSLEDQEAKCRAYAEAHGLEVSNVYRDEGASGAKRLDDRPAGRELLEHAALGLFSRVVVAKLDRFTRSVLWGAQDLATLAEYGIGVAFLDMGIDTSTTAGKLMLNVMIAFSDFERDTIRDRMVMGRQGAAADGRWPGGAAPYGWGIDPDSRTLVVNDEQAATLVRLFTLVADGHGPKAVADLFNAEGTSSARKGGTWSHVTVQQALRRDAYMTGKVERKQGGVRYTFPAAVLISPDLWRKANAKLNALKQERGQQKRKPVERRYPLSGHLSHLHDGTPVAMTGRYRRTAKLGRYYACSAADECPGLSTDHAGQAVKTLPSARIEAGLILWGLALLDSPEALEDWTAAYDRQALGAQGDDAKLLAQAIRRRDEQQGRREEMTKALAMGLLTADQLADGLADVDAELAKTEAMIERLASAQGRADALRMSIGALKHGDVARWLTEALEAPIEYPTPGDVDPTDPEHWAEVRSALEGEARQVLDGISAMGVGRPKAGTPKARDLAEWAQEWCQALVERFSLSVTVQDADASTWVIEGALPQRMGGPGTQAKDEGKHVPVVRFTTTLG